LGVDEVLIAGGLSTGAVRLPSAERCLNNDGPWIGHLRINGPAALTNECHSPYTELGAVVGPVRIAVGDGHSLALRGDGTVVGWGANTFGPTTIPAELSNVVAIAAGRGHSLALRNDGAVVGWGHGGYGQTFIPPDLNNVVAIAGADHSLALRGNGTVIEWGGNEDVPRTLGWSDVVAIAAGGGYSLALRSDGTVVGWGGNLTGPMLIPAGLNNVEAIAAGSEHALALRIDGTVVEWSVIFEKTFIPPGLTNAVAIAAGRRHSLALRIDGTVVGWGDDGFGAASFSTKSIYAKNGITLTGSVDTDSPGTYVLTYNHASGSAHGTATRTVVVRDTQPPAVTMVGDNPLRHLLGTPYVELGATAMDACGGNMEVLIEGMVDGTTLGNYSVNYVATDASGNAATNTRTVIVSAPPSIANLAAQIVGTNAAHGTRAGLLQCLIHPNGTTTEVAVEFGLTTAYEGMVELPDLPANFEVGDVSATVALSPGFAYHWRVIASNSLGTTISPDQILDLRAPAGLPGDLNGDGVVDGEELNLVYANYATNSPWLQMTNVAGLDGTNVTFALDGSLLGSYSAEYSTNLLDWLDHPIIARIFDAGTTDAGRPYR
jgi:hypothetical protein